jgi:predicted dehydrogenase/threonine dehydrogenase-like Zn-dependent dehydrogenase
MRQIFLDKGAVVVKEIAQPLLDDHSVLVAVHYSFIGSSLELPTPSPVLPGLFDDIPQKIKNVLRSISPVDFTSSEKISFSKNKIHGDLSMLSYSCSGQVLAIGKKVTRLAPGDWVACAGIGDGNYSDLLCIPELRAVRIQNKDYLRAASITTIGALALQGIRSARLTLGETVGVFGLGLIGQLTVQLAQRAGCRVIAIDTNEERLQIARQLNACAVYHADKDEVAREVMLLTEHHGVDSTIITAMSPSQTIHQAIDTTRTKGRIVVIGDKGPAIERDSLYKKEIEFITVATGYTDSQNAYYKNQTHDYPYAYVRWTENRNMQAFVQLIEQGALAIDPLISAEYGFNETTSAYKNLDMLKQLGIVLRHDEAPEYVKHFVRSAIKAEVLHAPLRFIPATKGTLRVGFVGAGGFAKVKLMPLVSQLKQVSIKAIVDADKESCTKMCQLYQGAKAYTNDDDLFMQDEVDVVIIASPHKFHCDQAIKAMQNGKAVFLEKPMVTDFEQLKRLKNFFEKNTVMPFCVDFNRSFSPLIQKIKTVTDKRTTPLAIFYRMNAGFIPQESWIQTDIGAGRIIGEACYIIDLFCLFTNSRPVAVSVETVHAGRDDIFPTDNFSAQIRFADGSLCTLLYTALGHSDLGRERMELFFDGKAIVLDDYMRLFGFGLPSWFNKTFSADEKGHEPLIQKFFDSLSNPIISNPIIPLDRLFIGAELTLIIDQLACMGGGEKLLTIEK